MRCKSGFGEDRLRLLDVDVDVESRPMSQDAGLACPRTTASLQRELVSNRRQFMGMAAGAAAVVPLSWREVSAAYPDRTISLRHITTKEELSTTYMRNGRFDADALDALDRFMRDWRTGDAIRMDRRLYDMLFAVAQRFRSDSPFVVVSGYRTEFTNDMLRRRGRGAAKNSLHTYGMAVDFNLPGIKLSALRREVMDLKAGGVGYYPRSHFLHMDTGSVRYW